MPDEKPPARPAPSHDRSGVAHASRLTDDALFDRALEDVRLERTDPDQVVHHDATFELQQRTTPKILERALAMLASPEVARRHLAANVLKEFPRLDDAPNPHSPEVVVALEDAARSERDEDALAAMLCAIGWQKLPQGEQVLLRYVDDARHKVRDAVANNLLMAVEPEMGPSEGVLDALRALSQDASSWIREGVFYEVAEFPELFLRQRERFVESARQVVDSHPAGETSEARRALRVLDDLGGPESPH